MCSILCSTVCRWIRTCGRSSTRGGGRIPPALVTGFWLRRASCAVPTWNEWWVTAASAIWTAICSWRQKLLNRRSRRRTAEPPEETNGGARAAMERSPARVSTKITLVRNTCEPRRLVVEVVALPTYACTLGPEKKRRSRRCPSSRQRRDCGQGRMQTKNLRQPLRHFAREHTHCRHGRL